MNDGVDAVDADMESIIADMRRARVTAPPFASIPLGMMRERVREQFRFWNENPPPVAHVRDIEINLRARPLRARLYDPHPEIAAKGAVVYLHGGGWVVGDLELEDTSTRYLANDSGTTILSIEYALAPEHRFPAAVADCIGVLDWLRENADTLGIDRSRIGIAGASAGANIAIAAALALRDRGDTWLRLQTLFYGAFDCNLATSSHRDFGDGSYGLSTAMMERFWELYLSDPGQRGDPLAVPVKANLAGLAPSFLVGAALDPLLDDTRKLAEELERAGCRVTLQVYPGVIHGFTVMCRGVRSARRAIADAGRFISSTLADSV